MSEDKGLTVIPYGQGYEAPKDTFAGTVDERRQALAEAFGLKLDKPDGTAKTLGELTVEASIVAKAIYHVAVKVGAKPETTIQAPKAPEQAEASEAPKADPPVEDPSLRQLITVASSEELDQLWKTRKDEFDSELVALAKQRREELK